jgi:pimeloyl-ACP methyl ester carboxylesterase
MRIACSSTCSTTIGTNVALYPQWQEFLRTHQPPTLIVWGKGDIFFTNEGAYAYLRDVKNVELHLLDSGHFVLEDHAGEVARLIWQFYEARIASRQASGHSEAA